MVESTSVGSTALVTTQLACAETCSIRSAKTTTFRKVLLDSLRNTAFL
jgi:hypothetical protein